MTKKAIVWIREDFRIENNEALAYASQNHEFVSALYIYNSKNFDKKREAQKWWLSKSLENFNLDLKKFNISLEIQSGDELEVFSNINKKRVMVAIAEGSEEIEAVTVINCLRRAKSEVTVAKVGN